jgi:hypothetical protein
MSMQIGVARIGGWLVGSEPDHMSCRAPAKHRAGRRPGSAEVSGSEGREAMHSRQRGVLIGSALFTGRWPA